MQCDQKSAIQPSRVDLSWKPISALPTSPFVDNFRVADYPGVHSEISAFIGSNPHDAWNGLCLGCYLEAMPRVCP
jgi:hypothetical protein